jgi:tetratricopeptide (TPR) repeat protein
MSNPFDTNDQDDFMIPQGTRKEIERLYRCLIDPVYLCTTWIEDELEVKADWVRLEVYSAHRLKDCYLPWFDFERNLELGAILGELFNNAGHLEPALNVYSKTAELAVEEGDLSLAISGYTAVAEIHEMRGAWRAALSAFATAQELYQQTNDLCGRLRMMNRQAAILQWRGRLEEALALLKEGEELSLLSGNPDLVFQNLFAQKRYFIAQRDWESAADLSEELHHILPHHGTASSNEERVYFLNGRADFCYTEGRWGEALDLYEEAEVLLRQGKLLRHISANLRNQVRVYLKKGDRLEGRAILEAVIRESRRVGDLYGLQDGLRALGAFLASPGPYEEAEEICQKLGYYEGLQLAQGERATLEEDGKLREKQEAICRCPGYTRYLADCLREKIKHQEHFGLDVKWDKKTLELLSHDPCSLENELAEEGEQWLCPWCRREAIEEVNADFGSGKACSCGALACGVPSFDLDDLGYFFLSAFYRRFHPSGPYEQKTAQAITENVERRKGKLLRHPERPFEMIYYWERLV